MQYVWLGISILLGALGQVFFKLGVAKTESVNLSFAFALELVKNPWVLAGAAAYGISFFLWLFALRSFEVSVARPLTSLGYLVTYLIAVIALGESFTLVRLAAILLITAGVILLVL